MIPLKQQHRHDPVNGVWGDCHRACVASILELPLADVPNFHAPPPGQQWEAGRAAAAERTFLLGHGYTPITFLYRGEIALAQVLMASAYYNPQTYWILGGKSRNNVGHSVVCFNEAIVHDPSLDQSGIVGPMDDGYWWATYIGAGITCKEAA